MLTISLKDFALTGHFGPVKIGMTKPEVISLLGIPEFEMDFQTGYTGVLYSRYEFFFNTETNILESIQNDHLQGDCENHKELIHFQNDFFTIDTWFIQVQQDITRGQIIELLTREGIVYQEETFMGHDIIRFESGVTLDFYDKKEEWVTHLNDTETKETVKVIEKPDDHVLNGIRFFPELI